jgi:hypothetical protein
LRVDVSVGIPKRAVRVKLLALESRNGMAE